MLVEYVWLDSDNNPRSKTRMLNEKLEKENLEIPLWTFDGSSTGQATGSNSEILLKPCAAFQIRSEVVIVSWLFVKHII